MKKASNWTQSALLGVIIVMMGWFMSDFSSWKNDITQGLKQNSIEHRDIERNISLHINTELVKNNERDLSISKLDGRVGVLENKVGLY